VCKVQGNELNSPCCCSGVGVCWGA